MNECEGGSRERMYLLSGMVRTVYLVKGMTATTLGTSSAKLQAGGEREDRGNTSTYTRRGLFRAGKPIKRSDPCCLCIRPITLFLALGLRSVALKSHFQAGQLHESPGGSRWGNGNMKRAHQARQATAGTSHFNRKWIEACHGTSRDDTWSGPPNRNLLESPFIDGWAY
jgi:hypothetical protein